mmetsp:Transcript_7763/g.17006  ORF Transcript_7763/g.17006 Transcript_7763/m.17006 type:complete len:252 (-) Transcript_7763:258-1013(-)
MATSSASGGWWHNASCSFLVLDDMPRPCTFSHASSVTRSSHLRTARAKLTLARPSSTCSCCASTCSRSQARSRCSRRLYSYCSHTAPSWSCSRRCSCCPPTRRCAMWSSRSVRSRAKSRRTRATRRCCATSRRRAPSRCTPRCSARVRAASSSLTRLSVSRVASGSALRPSASSPTASFCTWPANGTVGWRPASDSRRTSRMHPRAHDLGRRTASGCCHHRLVCQCLEGLRNESRSRSEHSHQEGMKRACP